MSDSVKISYLTGVVEITDRCVASIRTGDAAADMIIVDLENRLNKSADRIDALRAHAAKVTAEVRKDQIQLAAAKYIVWSARWAFTKILSQGLILPHAEWEHFNEMLPQVERWLVINDQVAVNFKEGAADVAAAIEQPTESEIDKAGEAIAFLNAQTLELRLNPLVRLTTPSTVVEMPEIPLFVAAPAALPDVTDDPAKCRTCGRSFYEEPAALLEGSLLLRALERMDRARAILTNSNPRPECNWGVLDTADIRAMLAAEKEK